MKKLASSLIFVFGITNLSAQSDSLKMSRKEAESIFLSKNFDLITQKLNISQARARVLQAKHWPNPTLSLSEINLWRTYEVDELPGIIGDWGKTSQIAAQIDQVIQTAGKRRKNIELQQIEVHGEEFELQEVLRELKKDLRHVITEIIYNQKQQLIYKNQIESIVKLTKSYQNQLSEGNISKAEYIRLKAQELDFKKKLVALHQDLEELQTEIKAFLILPADRHVYFVDDLEVPQKDISESNLVRWTQLAKENRPDILIALNQEKHAQKNLEIQQALKIPDLTFSINYDRGGNIMKDFIGVGIAMDLPIFDRNKGNIQEARIEIEKSGIETRKNKLKAENEITSAIRNYQRTQKIFEDIDADYEESLDKLLVSHEKNFRLRNISMLEYMDFLETYIDNKLIILDTKKELNQYFENLQYAVGQDL
ncbi:TolC family protein [Chryseobacterium koreense]|uniref:TolC family protein n=1 Tax=Chryseobacterium koreense TaxID=232216 RepID=UPI000A967F33|nr:TolC family protein [Chryseobacterium koreense]MBB5334583.1 cobalt-zinc-cadmium efflux system outer membrane protein [Chryseobacterium koreense]